MAESTRTVSPATSEEIPTGDSFEELRRQIGDIVMRFRAEGGTPVSAYEFEKELKTAFDALGRHILEKEFHRLEPADKKQAAARVRYHKETYRINKRTPAEIASSFGPIRLWSFLYLCEEAGEPGLHPLHLRLGIVAGTATAVLADRLARWSVDHSQREVRRLLQAEHGVCWSNDRLRRVLREFRRGLVAYRHEAQVQRVLQWLGEAERSRGRWRPVLAVGRDGTMIPIRGGGYQEASTATVAVFNRRRKRLGTIYLGQMPEKGQTTLTTQLLAVATEVLRQWTGPEPRLVYVTDKGKAQDAFYQRVLKRMRHPRTQRVLCWQWVLDFFHVCLYLNQMREALFGDKGYGWYERMRHWLRHRDRGVSDILRSAKQFFNRQEPSGAAAEQFWQAYRYLRQHRRWMDYSRYRRFGLPIGSGVTEAACKIIFTQRFKRSGMRWHKESGQVILDLRILYLSGVWDEVVHQDLQGRILPEEISLKLQKERPLRKAA